MTHFLKITSVHFRRLTTGQKKFEIRLNDRDYQVGDLIEFIPFTTSPNYMEGQFHPTTAWIITYVLTGFGIKKGHVALGVEPLRPPPTYKALHFNDRLLKDPRALEPLA